MLFSCSVTRVISLACFYDHRVAVSTPSNPFYCLSSSRLLPYLPFFSFLHTSITQCVHICIIPNPTHQNRVLLFIPHHLLHLLLPIIIFFSPSCRHRRPSPSTVSSRSPKNQPTRPPLQRLHRLLRRPSLFLFFAIDSHCGSCESDAQGENGIEESIRKTPIPKK